MTNVPDLSIIIASYNTLTMTRQCIESIYASTHNLDIEVIVVDDCSKDGSAEMVERDFPQVVVIRNAQNQRYSKTNNIGLRAARGRYGLLLNSDTLVRDGAFERLVRFMDNTPAAAAAGPKLLNPDGSIQHCVRGFPGVLPMIAQSIGLHRWFPNNWLTNQYYHEDLDYTVAKPIDSIGTTAFIIRRSTWENIGMLDERFTWAFVDWSYCAKLKDAGASVYVVPEAEVTHFGSASINQNSSKEIHKLHSDLRILYDIYYAPKHNFMMRTFVRLGIRARLQLKMLEHHLSSDKRVIKGPGAPQLQRSSSST